MKEYTHGGDIYDSRFLDRKIVDFSVNLNPLGMPAEVIEAAKNAVEIAQTYPDSMCRELTAAIAEHEGVEEEKIVCGNGAADLIFRMMSTFKPQKLLVTAPTFSEYERAAAATGAKVEYFHLKEEDGFALGQDIIGQLGADVDMVFLCNPNNPTGRLADRRSMLETAKRCDEKNIKLIVDECFLDLVENGDDFSLKKLLSENRNLILLKAFTKTFAMAGIRLGYALCASKEDADAIFMTGQPWSVSTIAQRAGIAALSQNRYLKESIAHIKEDRERLKAALESVGAEVFESHANYLLFKMKQGREIVKTMEEAGFLIRSCKDYVGLDERFMRIAVRGRDENTAFIKAIDEACKSHNYS